MLTLATISVFFRRLLASLLRLPTCRRHFDYVAGFGESRVAAHTTLTVSVHPNVTFRPERLVIPQDIARHFQVTDLKVGKSSQLASVGTVPAVLFSDQSLAVCLRCDVAAPEDLVIVTVVNQSDDTQVFRCTLVGPVI